MLSNFFNFYNGKEHIEYTFTPGNTLYNLHYKGNDIAAGTAAKAIKRAVFGVNVERRSFLAVKRAQSNHISAVALKIYI